MYIQSLQGNFSKQQIGKAAEQNMKLKTNSSCCLNWKYIEVDKQTEKLYVEQKKTNTLFKYSKVISENTQRIF